MNEDKVTQFVPRGTTRRAPDEPDPFQRAVLAELRTISRRLDEFAGAYLNARFPYGKGNDRWSRR